MPLHQPLHALLDAGSRASGRDQVVKVAAGVFQGERVRVGEMREEAEVEFDGEGKEWRWVCERRGTVVVVVATGEVVVVNYLDGARERG